MISVMLFGKRHKVVSMALSHTQTQKGKPKITSISNLENQWSLLVVLFFFVGCYTSTLNRLVVPQDTDAYLTNVRKAIVNPVLKWSLDKVWVR